MSKKKKASKSKKEPVKVLIEVVKGVEGPSVYINQYRVAGSKPWGGGEVFLKFEADKDDILTALKQKGI